MLVWVSGTQVADPSGPLLCAQPHFLLCDALTNTSQSYRTACANEEDTQEHCTLSLLRALGDLMDAGEPRVELAAAEALFLYFRGTSSPELRSSAAAATRALTLPAAAELPGLGMLAAERAEHAASEVRATGSTHPTRWERAIGLACRAGVVKRVCRALRREVRELAAADTDGDGGVDVAEYLRFRALNDGDAANDDDTLEQLAAAQGTTEGEAGARAQQQRRRE